MFNPIMRMMLPLIALLLASIPIIVNGVAFSFDASFHMVLSNLVNLEGISFLSNILTNIPTNYFAISISPNGNPKDYTIFALNQTKANCDYKYESSSSDIHWSGSCFSLASSNQPASFMIDCSIENNDQGESNFILVNFQNSYSTFIAFGDAKACFYQGENDNLFSLNYGNNMIISDSSSTITSSNTNKIDLSMTWTKQGTSDQTNPTVVVSCPVSQSS